MFPVGAAQREFAMTRHTQTIAFVFAALLLSFSFVSAGEVSEADVKKLARDAEKVGRAYAAEGERIADKATDFAEDVADDFKDAIEDAAK